tara:strand:+ start:822 stop:3071 length:2250 start_codon:yes stop_codon:yes gene_type:complete
MSDIHPESKLTSDLIKDYSEQRSNWAKQAVEDNEFRNGKQWSDKQVKKLRSRAQEPIVVNVIHSAVEQAKALLTSNNPRFQSAAREDSDVEVGRLFSDIMSWIWDQSNGNTVLKQVVDDYYVTGMGVMTAYVDPHKDFGKGDVCIEAINPLDLYIDPSSQDQFCRDSNHIIVGKKVMKSQLLDSYPEFAEQIDKALETNHLDVYPTTRHGLLNEQTNPVVGRDGQDSDEDKELELFERYTKVKIPYVRVFDPHQNREEVLNEEQFQAFQMQDCAITIKIDPQSGEEIKRYITADTEVQGLMGIHKKLGPVFHLQQQPNPQMPDQMMPVPVAGPEEGPMAVPGSTTEIFLLKKQEFIEDGLIETVPVNITNIKRCMSVGDEYLYSITMPIEEYPIIPFMNRHNRNPYPMSDVRLVKGLQEYINKIRSLIVAHASSSTNVKLLIPRGSMNKRQLEEEWGRAGTAVIEYDPELGSPIVAGPVPLPNELYKNEADAKADIERILGIYAMMQGDQGAAPQTYKGTIALDEFGQRRIRSKKDDIEACLNQIAKCIVSMVQWIYTDRKIVRILKPNNTQKQIKINQPIYDDITGALLGKTNDITIGHYDVQVVSGSTLPNNRWARFEYYKELYSMGVIDQVELLKQTDVADMEGVLDRAGREAQLQQQVQGLTEQVKNLKGDLQTAQRESLHDRKRVELKEFEVKLAKAEAKAEMASSLYKSRAGDELAKLKEAVSDLEDDPGSELRERNTKIIGL